MNPMILKSNLRDNQRIKKVFNFSYLYYKSNLDFLNPFICCSFREILIITFKSPIIMSNKFTRSGTILLFFLLTSFISINAQLYSKFIIVDQIGYLPDARKIAVIKNPQTGFDAHAEFLPGNSYALVNAESGDFVFTDTPVAWKNGMTDESSGDKTWHFDFSEVTQKGNYYILDIENNVRSFEFTISPSVYNEVLKQAVRTFFYQRSGFEKEAEYAGEAWADGASHIGPLQDKNCRLFSDKNNAATERDVHGGWYDAGDYNKYTSWTANYIVEMMKMYLERPEAWADNYNIPESGNGVPDLLDEAKWGVDHLLRLQFDDGSVISIIDEANGSPPSSATGQSLYGPPNTSATLNTAGALAISSKVYRATGMATYADTLLSRAEKAWNWAETYPDSLFNNNDPDYNSVGIGAGRMETNDYGRAMAKLEAACFLFDVTGDSKYRNHFDNNYANAHLIQWSFAYPFESEIQDFLLYYTSLDGATGAVASDVKTRYRNSMKNGEENFPAYYNNKDPYLAHLKDYVWGSNSTKSNKGNMFYNVISYDVDNTLSDDARDAAITYINYIHGLNPLNFNYLSNMYRYGAENGVNEFYHSWFTDGSDLWDRAGTSTYGPPPGFLTGGANPSYDWDDCCPGGCGSSDNNAVCTSESISPPKNQPKQKSYKDFNTSWPLNSWAVTENSCGYQVKYMRLLSKFVDTTYDCINTTIELNAQTLTAVAENALYQWLDCSNEKAAIEGATEKSFSPATSGNYAVRLVQDECIDTSACFSVEVTQVMYNSFDGPVMVYPNPVQKYLNVEFPDQQKYLEIHLTDIRGKAFITTTFHNQRNIRLDMEISPGIYLVNVKNEKDQHAVLRIVK